MPIAAPITVSAIVTLTITRFFLLSRARGLHELRARLSAFALALTSFCVGHMVKVLTTATGVFSPFEPLDGVGVWLEGVRADEEAVIGTDAVVGEVVMIVGTVLI